MNSQKVHLIFEVQTVSNEPNAPKSAKTSLMAVEDDRHLDFSTFKRYMFQQVGILENVPVSYVDEDNDQIPIESEEEFKEAIKVARERSAKGMLLVLIVDISRNTLNKPDSTTNIAEEFEKVKMTNSKTKIGARRKDDKKTSAYRLSHGSDRSRFMSSNNNEKARLGVKSTPSVNIRTKILQQVLANLSSSSEALNASEGPSRIEDQIVEQPPAWFISYMDKFKADILLAVEEMIMNKRRVLPHVQSVKTKLVQVKRHSEDESSDNQQCGSEPRSCKILRKLEKLQKREKKLEHKLDQRLEKMETKKKRMLEKVSQTKTVKRKSCEGSSSVPYLMGMICVKPLSPRHVFPGQTFSRTWEVLNDGTIPWTEATEMRQAWGSAGLDPITTVVKCPLLRPGEQGLITVVFTAPVTPGTFHSYWHLFHMGERFGHWVGCTVIVDAKETEESEEATVPEFANPFNNNLEEVEKELAEKLKAVSLARKPEYDSSSDLEVCSYISESDSVDSFVLVDLPMSLFSDSPAENKGTIPFKVRSKNCKIYSKSDKKKISKTSKNEANVGGEASQQTSENTSVSDSTPIETEPPASCEPVQGSVYMVDRAGNCIVAPSSQPGRIYPLLEPTHNMTYPVFTQQMPPIYDVTPNYYCYPPVMSYPYPGVNPEYPIGATASSVTQSAGNFATATSSQTINTGDIRGPIEGEINDEIPTLPTDNDVREKRAKPASNQNLCDYINASPEPESVKRATGNEVNGSPVHILPETLVNGAINVASKAFNTAQSVISNLRTKQGEASEYDPALESNLATLFEMGFTNASRNSEVLKSVGNNIVLALPILLEKARQQ